MKPNPTCWYCREGAPHPERGPIVPGHYVITVRFEYGREWSYTFRSRSRGVSRNPGRRILTGVVTRLIRAGTKCENIGIKPLRQPTRCRADD